MPHFTLRASLTIVALSAPISAWAQAPAAETPPPTDVRAPSGYPRDKSLAVIHKWIQDEYTRVAREEHYRRAEERRKARKLRGEPEIDEGLSDDVISVYARADIMPVADWSQLATRCRDELRSEKADERKAAILIAWDLSEIVRSHEKDMAIKVPADLGDACRALLKDPDSSVRQSAAGIVSRIKEFEQNADDSEILPLLALLKDDNPQTRRSAAGSLSMIGTSKPDGQGFGKHSPEVVAAMLSLLNDPERMIRTNAFMIIGSTGEAGKAAVPKLIEIAEGKPPITPNDQRAAMFTLGRLGASAAQAVPTLRNLLKSSDESTRMRAITALRTMGPTARDAVPDLIGMLENPDSTTRSMVTRAIGGIGPDAAAAVPRLLRNAARRTGPRGFGERRDGARRDRPRRARRC